MTAYFAQIDGNNKRGLAGAKTQKFHHTTPTLISNLNGHNVC